jgi:prepilin-type N-terminal cleavage/methylation domain-containing protein
MMKNKKGFTLVELLVVIAIIALLMGILMPALARVRQIAFRMKCGTNLSGIGKAMLIYANDYEDELPRAGGRDTAWGPTANWAALDRYQAYGLDASGSQATIGASFYLLIKYAEVTPKSFVCKGDSGVQEFKISEESDAPPAGMEFIDAWDFGRAPHEHCSYTYHLPYSLYALTVSHEPGMAVAADRNPFLESPGASAIPLQDFNPGGTIEQQKAGNSPCHQKDGQNVLFLDSHVTFEKRAYCAINDDNVYTRWPPGTTNPNDTTRRIGQAPSVGTEPGGRSDSYLVHDPPDMTGGGTVIPGR